MSGVCGPSVRRGRRVAFAASAWVGLSAVVTGCGGPAVDSGALPEQVYLDLAYGPVQDYTGNDGQWLNLYRAASDGPTPVYVWAHGNGHTYRDAHERYAWFVETLLEAGISVVSWESIAQMDGDNYPDIMADADVMFAWLGDHAGQYGLDMTRLVVGGHSRGSIASWRLAHGGDPGIRGIYLGDAAGNLDDVNALDDRITAGSPPIRMAYNGTFTRNDGQHDPNEGQKIIDRYRELGFDEPDARLLVDQGYPSMTEPGFYADLPSFCEEVLGR